MLLRLIRLATILALVLATTGCDLLKSEPPPQEQAQLNFNQGMAKLKAGDHAGAATLFGEACRLDPSKPDYLLKHGMALAKAGDVGQAVMSLSKAADMMPDSIEPGWQLGVLYQDMNRRTEEYGPKKVSIRRYQKRDGAYMPRSKFNISSLDQARKIISALENWAGEEAAEGEGA